MNTDIHRLLDEAFQGVDMTPDAQDLKEEVRANLVARTAELEASGAAPADAARQARAARPQPQGRADHPRPRFPAAPAPTPCPTC